jgi:hypothetical protein
MSFALIATATVRIGAPIQRRIKVYNSTTGRSLMLVAGSVAMVALAVIAHQYHLLPFAFLPFIGGV